MLRTSAENTLEPRILEKFTFAGPYSEACESHCWEWTAGKEKGYGRVVDKSFGFHANGTGRKVLAHRLVYTYLIGEIPTAVHLDHRCHNKACVNPSHLRVTTTKQNAEHRKGARRTSTSGIRGVSWHTQHNKWQVQVRHYQRTYYFGYHTDITLAEAVAIVCRSILFTHDDAHAHGLSWAWAQMTPETQRWVDKAHNIKEVSA